MSPAGYSGTPQSRKLGIKPGLRVALDSPPEGWELTGPLPELAPGEHADSADLIVAFFTAADQFSIRLPRLAERIYPAGMLWIAWPRRAAGHLSDISDNFVRARVLELGLVDTKIAAIDDDWSGQKAVWRVNNRSHRAPPPLNSRFLVDERGGRAPGVADAGPGQQLDGPSGLPRASEVPPGQAHSASSGLPPSGSE